MYDFEILSSGIIRRSNPLPENPACVRVGSSTMRYYTIVSFIFYCRVGSYHTHEQKYDVQSRFFHKLLNQNNRKIREKTMVMMYIIIIYVVVLLKEELPSL